MLEPLNQPFPMEGSQRGPGVENPWLGFEENVPSGHQICIIYWYPFPLGKGAEPWRGGIGS